MIIGVADLRHHKVASCIGGNRGRAIVGQTHVQTCWHGGDGGGARAAIEGGRGKTTEGDGSDGLAECFLRAQCDRVDLDEFRGNSIDAAMLPTRAVAGIGDELNTVDAGETDAIGRQWQPCASSADFRTGRPDTGIQIREKLDCDGIGWGTHQIHGTQAIKRKSAQGIRRARSRAHSRSGENGARFVVSRAHQRPVSRPWSADDVSRAYNQSRGIDQRAPCTTNDAASACDR